MKHDYTIEDGDLSFRQPTKEDAETVRIWRNQEEIRQYFIYTGEITKEQQEKWYEDYLNSDSDIMFIMEWQGRPVGTVSLYNVDRQNNTAEIGRLMVGATEARGKRFGQRALKAACDFGIQTLGLKEIYGNVLADNPRSLNALLAIGFVIKENKMINDRLFYYIVKSA